MYRYTITTESKNVDAISEIVGGLFDSFTIQEGKGVWRSQAERALIITIYGGQQDSVNVPLVASRIKVFNNQKCVLVTEETCTYRYI